MPVVTSCVITAEPVNVGSSVMLELVLAVHSYHVIAYHVPTAQMSGNLVHWWYISLSKNSGNSLGGNLGEMVSLQARISLCFQLRETFKCIEHIGKGKTYFKTSPWNQKIEEKLRNFPKFSDRQVWANSADPDQTAPRGAVWTGSTLFAIPSASFECITLRKSDLVQLLGWLH